MVLKEKKNKGFTLVELIVAIAVLAFLITAVVTIMGHESAVLKKSEADITVQTSAQETYNDISDIIMQAKSIRVVGYVTNDGSDIIFPKKSPGETYEGADLTLLAYSKKSEAIASDLSFEKYGVNLISGSESESDNEESESEDADINKMLKTTTISGGVSSSQYRKLYLTRIYVDYSVPYDSAYVGDTPAPTGTDKDTCSAEIIFDANRIYITKKYKYMTKLNSTFSNSSSDVERDACLYTSKLNYLRDGARSISAAIATVDSDNQSISLELRFLDNKMTYTVSGITNVKNSNVFIDAK